MTRIIGGIAGGRRIEVPPKGTRPTSDRVREALFSALDHALGTWHGVHALDLYAGSGALGLEALSRGAEHALLVDRAAPAVEVLRRNIAAVGLPGAAALRADAARLAAAPPPASAQPPYDLVLLDPPYDLPTPDLGDVLAALAANGWLTADCTVVLERAAASGEPVWPEGFTALRDRRYGDTALWLGRGPGS